MSLSELQGYLSVRKLSISGRNIETITYCPKCNKLSLEPGEFEEPSQNSVQCDICEKWYHWGCESFKDKSSADSLI